MSMYTWYLLHSKKWLLNFDDLFFSYKNIPFLPRMMQKSTKIITTKKRWLNISKKYTKETINGYVYVKNIINSKIIWHEV